jgi:hypothetical protein
MQVRAIQRLQNLCSEWDAHCALVAEAENWTLTILGTIPVRRASSN